MGFITRFMEPDPGADVGSNEGYTAEDMPKRFKQSKAQLSHGNGSYIP